MRSFFRYLMTLFLGMILGSAGTVFFMLYYTPDIHDPEWVKNIKHKTIELYNEGKAKLNEHQTHTHTHN